MNGKVIGLSLLALSVISTVGGAGYLATQEPELFNDFIRTAAYTPKQAYEIGIPERVENKLYENGDGKILPFVIKTKEDITKIDSLHSDVFDSGSNPFDVKSIKAQALAFFEEPEYYRQPFSISGTTSGKDGCFIIGATDLFEQQSLLARCGIDRNKVYDYVYDKAQEDVSSYLDYYNDKYSQDELIDKVYVDYYYRAAGDVKATIQFKKLGDKYDHLIQQHLDKRASKVDNPYYDFNVFTNAYVELARTEIDAGNINPDTNFEDIFSYINEQIIDASISSYNILELLMFEKEAIERNNTSRTYIFDDDEIRTFLGLPNKEN